MCCIHRNPIMIAFFFFYFCKTSDFCAAFSSGVLWSLQCSVMCVSVGSKGVLQFHMCFFICLFSCFFYEYLSNFLCSLHFIINYCLSSLFLNWLQYFKK